MNNLKLFAGQIITKSKLTKESKLQLLKFIQYEATDSQIKAFLMDGKITKLNEEAEDIVNERFEVHETKQLVNEIDPVTGMVMAGSVLYGLVLGSFAWAAYRAIKSVVSKKARQCGTLSIGMKRKVCLAKLKLEEATKIKNLIIKDMKNCNKQKNPQKCIAKHKKVIQKMINKEKKYSDKLKTYNMRNLEKSVQGLERAQK